MLCASPAFPVQAAPGGAASYSFAFHEADLADVSEAILGRALGLTYSVDPGLTAKISFRIDQRLTAAQLLQAFEATLASNDIAIVKNGSALVLEKRSRAKSVVSVRSVEEGRHAIGYQTLAVPLTYASPAEVAKALEAVGAGGAISYVDDEHNMIVLGGTGQEIDAALQTIKLFDRNSVQSAQIRWFPLTKAPAASVADEVTQLMHARRIAGASLVALKRLNGIFAFARNGAELDEIGAWIAKLDIPSEDKSNTLWIYRPKYASAENLNAALAGVFGVTNRDAATTQAADASRKLGDPSVKPPAAAALAAAVATSQPDAAMALPLISGGDAVRTSVDKDTNALIISASSSQWLQIQKLLDELDRAPGEVLVEASIIEVTLTNDTSFGVDFTAMSKNGRLTGGSIGNGSGPVGTSFPGFSIAYLGTNLQAAVSALGSTSRVEVVSAPKIMVLDGKTATLDVGDQVPVVTQSAQSTLTGTAPLVNTVDYRNTGVILKVTPRITGDDNVSLDVSQEVSSVSSTTTSGIDSPTILQRTLASSLRITDGSVVGLGGMISSNKSTADTGIPYVKDIPILGNLFKTSNKSLARTELVILLTAKIIRNAASAESANAALVADMHDLVDHGLIKSIH